MPPPVQNDNQGLKIAVACFVMLSVILAVTTYFGFKNYGEADKAMQVAQSDASSEKKAHDDIERLLIDVKDKAGYPKTENSELPKAITKDREALVKKAAESADDARKAIAEWKTQGGGNAKLDELSQTTDTILSGMNDPAQSLLSMATRQQELLSNQAMIALRMSLEFQGARKLLEDANGVNAQKLQVESDAYQKSKTDLEDEHNKHEQERQALMAKLDALQTELNRSASENQTLKNTIAQRDDDYKTQRTRLLAQFKETRDQLDKRDTVLDVKDGTITFVDYGRGEVRTDLTRRMGAKEQMVMTIFDKDAPGLPSDKPKATIELIQVGTSGSIARIIDTKSSINPIRIGDQVYSSVWDANKPIKFALIGTIDVNRDGRDDRADLKRMIESGGGKVVYDLPPPGAGQETGELTPLVKWYVIDERGPMIPSRVNNSPGDAEQEETFLKKKSAAIALARDEGIRPKPIDRLLNEFGYSFDAKIPGRVEAADPKAIDSLLNPKGKVGTLPPAEGGDGAEGDQP